MRRAEIAGLGVADIDFEHKCGLGAGQGQPAAGLPLRPQDGPGCKT
jgi:integrase